MQKPTLPQGTRDFDSTTLRKRQHIFSIVKNIFERYGFQPLETPAIENIETLLGKYGEEGDKLIFKILNNGLANATKHNQANADFENVLAGKTIKGITERALRYDLTIPLARYVAMNINQLTLPFRRYQIQPVWRADRPQRGRYREFYQCDADVVGSISPLNEVELVNIYTDVFNALNIAVAIKINNRKILSALATSCGGVDKMIPIVTAIDKLDKIGIEKVKEELAQRNIANNAIELIEQYLFISGTNNEKLQQLKTILGNDPSAQRGCQEIEYVLTHCANTPLIVDFTLARGLNYYTGTIFEVVAKYVPMGSIGGGGRYDNLTELFGVANVAGVGISFGVDRIFDVMEELKIFPENIAIGTQVLFFNLGDTLATKAFELMQTLRSINIRCEVYHEEAKFDKQFKYAEKKHIPFVVILGNTEMENNTCVIKNLRTGNQQSIAQTQLATYSFE